MSNNPFALLDTSDDGAPETPAVTKGNDKAAKSNAQAGKKKANKKKQAKLEPSTPARTFPTRTNNFLHIIMRPHLLQPQSCPRPTTPISCKERSRKILYSSANPIPSSDMHSSCVWPVGCVFVVCECTAFVFLFFSMKMTKLFVFVRIVNGEPASPHTFTTTHTHSTLTYTRNPHT